MTKLWKNSVYVIGFASDPDSPRSQEDAVMERLPNLVIQTFSTLETAKEAVISSYKRSQEMGGDEILPLRWTQEGHMHKVTDSDIGDLYDGNGFLACVYELAIMKA